MNGLWALPSLSDGVLMSGEHFAEVRERVRAARAQDAASIPGADRAGFADEYLAAPDKRCTPRVIDGVAIAPLQAPMLYHGRSVMADLWMGWISYQCAAAEAERMMLDGSVKAVIYDVNCPGGTVPGAREFVDAVKALCAAKPVYMIAHDMATSGAYWPFAGCVEIVVTPTGMVGSVGQIGYLDDTTRMFEQMGVKRTLVASPGELKGEGMEGVAVSAAMVERRTARQAEQFAMFAQDVASGRGMTLDQVRALGGGVYAARESVAAKLATVVEPFKDAVARIVNRHRGGGVVGVVVVSAAPPAAAGNQTEENAAGLSPAETTGDAGHGRTAQELTMDLSKLTEEQLRGGAPGLVEAIEAKARKSAAPAPASLEELEKVYAGDPGFVLECLRGKLSIDQAKVAWGDKQAKAAQALGAELATANTALAAEKAKTAKLEADLAAARRNNRGADPVPTDHGAADDAAAGGGGGGADYMSLVNAKKQDLIAKDNKKPFEAEALAHQIVQRTNPAEYAKYKEGTGYGVHARRVKSGG